MRSLKPLRAHLRRLLIGWCVLAALLGVGGMRGIHPQPTQANANANGQAPAITFIPIFTPTRTPTRTPTPVNFGNLVWNDLDGDGLQDAGEPGLAGVNVQLWSAAKNDLIDSAISDANGHYSLTSAGPGNYRIRALLPVSGDQFTGKDAGDDLKDSDINASGTDFGFTDIYVIGSNVISIVSIDIGIRKFATPTPTRTPTPINIGNSIWADDGDGVQETGEVGLANVTLRLWNANTNQVVDTAVSNANGNYTLVAPFPGDYRIEVVPGIGAAFTPKDIGVDDQKDSDCNTDGVNLGFTDVFNIASNVISTTKYDCGLLGPYSTATPTPTQEPTSTFTPVPTSLFTATPTSTSTPESTSLFTMTPMVSATTTPEFWLFLPLARR